MIDVENMKKLFLNEEQQIIFETIRFINFGNYYK